MKTLFLFFVICLLAIGLGLLMHKDSGYVLISYLNWSVETSLWTLIISVLIAFFLISLLIRIVKGGVYLSTRLYEWPSRHRYRKIQRDMNQGIYALVEGNWLRAESYFKKSLRGNPQPLINYMGAAIAAQKQGESLRRENYLQEAQELNPNAEITLGFLQAQLQIDGQEWQNALSTLEKLKKLTGSHPHIEELLKKIAPE